MGPSLAAGKREFFAVGDAVDPDGAGAEEIADSNGEIARSSARGDHHIRPLAPDQSKDGNAHTQQGKLVPAVGLGNDTESCSRLNRGAVARLGSHIGDITIGETGAKSEQLDPVTSSGGNSEHAEPLFSEALIRHALIRHANSRHALIRHGGCVERIRRIQDFLPRRRIRRSACKPSSAELSLASIPILNQRLSKEIPDPMERASH